MTRTEKAKLTPEQLEAYKAKRHEQYKRYRDARNADSEKRQKYLEAKKRYRENRKQSLMQNSEKYAKYREEHRIAERKSLEKIKNDPVAWEAYRKRRNESQRQYTQRHKAQPKPSALEKPARQIAPYQDLLAVWNKLSRERQTLIENEVIKLMKRIDWSVTKLVGIQFVAYTKIKHARLKMYLLRR